MKATEKDIVPGRILYYVSARPECGQLPRISSKVIVTSTVYTHVFDSGRASKLFKCIDDHRPYGFDWEHKNQQHFLNDVGMGGESVYNLHRIFSTEKSALAYVDEVLKGKFTDPEDQRYYDYVMSKEYQKRKKEEDALWDAFDDCFDDID